MKPEDLQRAIREKPGMAKLNPTLAVEVGAAWSAAIGASVKTCRNANSSDGSASTAIKPLLNKTEARYRDVLKVSGKGTIWEQAITLRLDPPFKSYRPDLAYLNRDKLTFVEVKGPHRFREKGIAKVALAAKTYPPFDFVLAEWKDGTWKVTEL